MFICGSIWLYREGTRFTAFDKENNAERRAKIFGSAAADGEEKEPEPYQQEDGPQEGAAKAHTGVVWHEGKAV